jgi:hypothetical protein
VLLTNRLPISRRERNEEGGLLVTHVTGVVEGTHRNAHRVPGGHLEGFVTQAVLDLTLKDMEHFVAVWMVVSRVGHTRV